MTWLTDFASSEAEGWDITESEKTIAMVCLFDQKSTMLDTIRPWCLVLMIWGNKYSDKHVSALVSSVKNNSRGCARVILVTDRIRLGLEEDIEQKPIPRFFNKPAFFEGGYVVKLSVFHKNVLPRNMPCVYLDLDTIVVGDIGKIASLVSSPNSYYMLPPGNLVGFGRLRRWLYKKSNGRRFATGNSSVLAFHSCATPNLCEEFERLYNKGITEDRRLKIDDVFISWFAQLNLNAIPSSLAVMFRREFLSRSRLLLELKRWSPRVSKRRREIVVVTFNGAQHKPEEFLSLKENDIIVDEKNRFGFWSDHYLGEFRMKILMFAKDLLH